MENENLKSIISLIGSIEKNEDFSLRLVLANNAKKSIDDFIESEIRAAQTAPKESKLSWVEIGKALGLSKGAVYAKYGAKYAKRISNGR